MWGKKKENGTFKTQAGSRERKGEGERREAKGGNETLSTHTEDDLYSGEVGWGGREEDGSGGHTRAVRMTSHFFVTHRALGEMCTLVQ